MENNTQIDQKFSWPKRRLFMWLKFLIIALFIFVIVRIIADIKSYEYIGEGVTPANTITVIGKGDILATPDIGEFSFAVMAQATTASDAESQSASSTNAILGALKASGIAAADLKTTDYTLTPRYASDTQNCPVIPGGIYCPPTQGKVIGYTVSETIDVKVRNLDQAGNLLSQVTTLGATNVSGLSFTSEDMTTLQDQARAKAISDAEARAKTLASELHVSLGRVVSFSDQSQPIYYAAPGVMEASTGSTSVVPQTPTGQNDIVSNVSVTYEIR